MAKILAVDDQLVMRKMVAVALESAGHQVTALEDGIQAYRFATSNEVDIVISDINMPYIQGTTLIRRLRTLPAYEDIPMLMLTTESSDEMKRLARENGADGWIQKPFDAEKLVHAVDKILTKFDIH
ncbi:MAG: hypothetical protein COB51_08360 [Moraxellaceae bacterium]|nr:MAG: hypothetical protein COB51_08360 [Moraxellaceae bacterium]